MFGSKMRQSLNGVIYKVTDCEDLISMETDDTNYLTKPHCFRLSIIAMVSTLTLILVVAVVCVVSFSVSATGDDVIITNNSRAHNNRTTETTTPRPTLSVGQTCLIIQNSRGLTARVNSTGAEERIVFTNAEHSSMPELKVSIRSSFEHRIRGVWTNDRTYRFLVRQPEPEASGETFYLMSKCGEPVSLTTLNGAVNMSRMEVLKDTLFLVKYNGTQPKYNHLRLRTFQPLTPNLEEYGCYLKSGSGQFIASNIYRFVTSDTRKIGEYDPLNQYDFMFVMVDC